MPYWLSFRSRTTLTFAEYYEIRQRGRDIILQQVPIYFKRIQEGICTRNTARTFDAIAGHCCRGRVVLQYTYNIAILYYNISYKMNIHIVVAAHLFQTSRRNSTVDLLIVHRCTKGRNGYSAYVYYTCACVCVFARTSRNILFNVERRRLYI